MMSGGGLVFPAAAAFGDKYCPRLRRGLADVFLAAGGGKQWRRGWGQNRRKAAASTFLSGRIKIKKDIHFFNKNIVSLKIML